jgi:subfamily B ATP-binding cassette protein HlyB/CyaB
VVARVGENKILVQSSLAPRPDLLTREEFVAVWDGRLILMTGRALGKYQRSFQ